MTSPPLPSWVTADIDLSTPSAARVYDFLLGGMHNFAVDRDMGRRLERELPGTTRAAWANRAFLQRAVRYCASTGIDQYLDIGCLTAPETRDLIDFDRPVAVLLVSILEVIPDADRPAELVARLTTPTGPGSHLVISHFGPNFGTPAQIRTALEAAARTRTPAVQREPDQLLALLGDFVPVPPGVVPLHEWHPDQGLADDPSRSHGYAVVARRGPSAGDPPTGPVGR